MYVKTLFPHTGKLLGDNVLTNACTRLKFQGVATTKPTISDVKHYADASFDLEPFKLYLLDKGPSPTASLDAKDAIKIYTEMVRIRRLEASAAELYKEKMVRGFCHLYTGQEAIAVGIHSVMRPTDSVITSYRCHAWTYLMSGNVHGVLAELTGRKPGVSRGKGGSMHMYAKNFYGGNGIVGAHIPLGAGLAFAHKYKGDGGICYTLYGDGASNQGQIQESYNMAKLWSLPVVFICENNRYGLGTAMKRHSASTEYYKRGYYIPGFWSDGMDVLACREAARFMIDYVGGGKGPLVVEFSTYRYFGHSMSDPGTSYRTREEVQEVRKTKDPIMLFMNKIVEKNIVPKEELQAIDKTVRKEVDAAAKQARSDPEVGIEEMTADVYAKSIGPIRGVRPDVLLPHISIRNHRLKEK